MGMMDDWKNKFATATPGGINPTAPPQQFLGQILNNVIGDKAATDGDGIRESASPIDFLAPEAAGALGKIGSKAGQVVAESAPRFLTNEVGSVGRDISPMSQAIKDVASKSSVNAGTPVASQTVTDVTPSPPKNFFDNARAKAQELGIGASPAEQAQFATQKANTQAMIRARNSQQIDNSANLSFQNLKSLLSNRGN